MSTESRSVLLARRRAKECKTACCIAHTPLVSLLAMRILSLVEMLGTEGECSQQPIHLDLTGRDVSHVAAVRYHIGDQWVVVKADEAPSCEEAYFRLLLKVEALARAATGGASA